MLQCTKTLNIQKMDRSGTDRVICPSKGNLKFKQRIQWKLYKNPTDKMDLLLIILEKQSKPVFQSEATCSEVNQQP